MLRLATAIVLVSLVSPTIAAAAPPELAGRWSGYWVSDANGHTGPLHARFNQIDDETYRVRYHGRFALIVPFWYSTEMHVVGAGDGMIWLEANRNLGPLLGNFSTRAQATDAHFDAQFTSRNDSGRFVLTRRR